MGNGQAELARRLAFRRYVAGRRDMRRRYGRLTGTVKGMQMCLQDKGLEHERKRDGKCKQTLREPGAPDARICHGHSPHDIPDSLGWSL